MNTVKSILKFTENLRADGIGSLSAQAAFFMILSFFPFIMLLVPFIKYIPINESLLKDLSQTVLPDRIEEMLDMFAAEIYARPSVQLISITALTTLWTASKGALSVMRGFNVVNKVEETRGYIFLRMFAVLYTVIIILFIMLMFAVFLFGNLIYNYITHIFPALRNAADAIIGGRTIVGFLLLTVFFWFFYCVLPNRKCSLFSELPGSIFSAAAWIGFSYVYSFYIDNISNYSYIYGSLSAMVFLMLWLYICMYIIFIGEEINIFLKDEI